MALLSVVEFGVASASSEVGRQIAALASVTDLRRLRLLIFSGGLMIFVVATVHDYRNRRPLMIPFSESRSRIFLVSGSSTSFPFSLRCDSGQKSVRYRSPPNPTKLRSHKLRRTVDK